MRRIVVSSIVALITVATGFARHHHSHSGGGNGGNQPNGQAGEFDYYLLSLSWSPEFCSNHSDPEQCQGTRKYTFVVHGLWPQYEKGWPQFCQPSSPVPADLAGSMLDLMPNRQLIQHEWDKHGTCSGLGPRAYFETIRKARSAVKIPIEYLELSAPKMVAPTDLEEAFIKINPGLSSSAISVTCDSTRLSEVRICLSKDLQFRACEEVERRACRRDQVAMPPVRGG